MTPAVEPELRRLVREAPKVELHLHLDGAMSLPWLLERIGRVPDPPCRFLIPVVLRHSSSPSRGSTQVRRNRAPSPA